MPTWEHVFHIQKIYHCGFTKKVIAQNYSHTLYHIALQYTIDPMLLMQHGEKKKKKKETL